MKDGKQRTNIEEERKLQKTFETERQKSDTKEEDENQI
jgi:hypothetical protein